MLSVILPVFDEGEQLQHYLEALHDLRGTDCELIGVDGGSSDNSLALLQQHCDQALGSAKGRARQMNAGAAVARGDNLLFLHADTLLPLDAKTLISSALASADWGRFDVKLNNDGAAYQVISSFINWRSRLTRVCTGDQALFFRAEFFKRLGSYPDIPLMEDVAICKIAKSLGTFAALDTQVITSARRWQSNGIMRTVFLMWELRLRYFLGQSPHSLVRRYYD